MDKETKVFLGIGVALIAIVIGGAVFLSKSNPQQSQAVDTPSVETTTLVTDSSNKIGPADAKVTVVEFSDFQCPGCAAAYPALEQAIEQYKDKVLFVYRHFPLETIHKNAQLASLSAEAAGAQNKFWEMSDMLFVNQEKWSNESNAKDIFISYAKELQLDEEKFTQDLENNELSDKINNDYSDGLKAGVNSTPTFFINGVRYPAVFSFEELKQIIETELNK